MRRRILEELGIQRVELSVVLPDYRYRAERDGVVENELCPVAVGLVDEQPAPNPDEVGNVVWLPWSEALIAFADADRFSPWCIEEAELLDQHPSFQTFLRSLGEAREIDTRL